MANVQVFFATAGVMVTLTGLLAGFFKYYLDAKVDPVAKQVDVLVQYMVSHEGKIGTKQ